MKKLLAVLLAVVLLAGAVVPAFALEKPLSDLPDCFYTVENGDIFFKPIYTSDCTQAELDYLKDFFDVLYRGKESNASYLVSMSFNGLTCYLSFIRIEGSVTHLQRLNPTQADNGFFRYPATTSLKNLSFIYDGRNSSFAAKSFYRDTSGLSVSSGAGFRDYANVFISKNFNIPATANWTVTHEGNLYFKGDRPDIFYMPSAQHALTVHYQHTDGSKAADSVTQTLAPNATYSVASPSISGYTPDTPTVTGTMPDRDLTVTVTYTETAMLFHLTVKYQFEDGAKAADSVTSAYLHNQPYYITSPTLTGYTPDLAVVSGRMSDADATVIVTYAKTTDPGGNPGGDPGGNPGGNPGGSIYDPFQKPEFGEYDGYNPFQPPTAGAPPTYDPFQPPTSQDYDGYNPFKMPSFENWPALNNPFEKPPSNTYSGYDPFAR